MKPPDEQRSKGSLKFTMKYLPFTLAFIFACTLLLPSVQAQEPVSDREGFGQQTGDDVLVTLSGEARARIPLAFPGFSTAGAISNQASLAARELEATLRDDLAVTHAFDIQGPDALSVLTLTGDPKRDLELYRSLGNEILLLAELRQEGQKLVFDGRLLDLKNGEPILGKRYEGTFGISRTIAHTFADEIVRYMLGRRGIALTSIAFTSDRSGSKEIYLMDYDGHGQRRITAHKSLTMFPSWSPSGAELAYLSYLNGPPGIFRVDLATGKKITIISDDKHNIAPALSPDGRTMAFSRSLAGNTDIYAFDLRTGSQRKLTQSRAIDTNPAFSPSGRQIAFTSSRTGNPHIFIMDSDGTNVRRITFDRSYNDGASWNPEGNRVAYATRVRGVFQIAITDVVTLETVIVTSGSRNKEEPTFSPDGERIAFTSKGRGGDQIYLMDLQGQVLKQVTSEGNNSSPSWSPYPAK